jgi:hypothetical protein
MAANKANSSDMAKSGIRQKERSTRRVTKAAYHHGNLRQELLNRATGCLKSVVSAA